MQQLSDQNADLGLVLLFLCLFVYASLGFFIS